MEYSHTRRCNEAIAGIDRGLDEASHITIESALDEAVRMGRMSIKEAEECKIAYLRSFMGGVPADTCVHEE